MKYTSEEIGFPNHSVTDSSDSARPFLAEYFLTCSAESTELNFGTWSFSLDSVDAQISLEAHDTESGDLNRLALLAAVRGLEAIDGASDVTLMSQNRYLIRSLTDSLPRWRANQFAWQHFGRRMEVQNADLWRRIDHALTIHRIEACLVSSRLVSREGTSLENVPAGLDHAAPVDTHPIASSNALGHNLGGIQWRADTAHTTNRPPASQRQNRPSKKFGRDQLRHLLSTRCPTSPPTTGVGA